jgi:hypothetical protein
MKIFLLSLAAVLAGYGHVNGQSPTPIKVELITRAVSKTPVLIAYDKGLYKKYGRHRDGGASPRAP